MSRAGSPGTTLNKMKEPAVTPRRRLRDKAVRRIGLVAIAFKDGGPSATHRWAETFRLRGQTYLWHNRPLPQERNAVAVERHSRHAVAVDNQILQLVKKCGWSLVDDPLLNVL